MNNYIEQTNRTILFERLNARMDSIISIIYDDGKTRESLNDEEMKLIREKLEVSSFEDMVQKFHPEVYMYIDTDRCEVKFSREVTKEDNLIMKVIPLCENESFIYRLLSLMKNKKFEKYVVSSFRDFCESMLPIKKREEFFSMRKSIFEYVKNNQLIAAKRVLTELVEEYDDGIFLLKVFLDEIEDTIIDNAMSINQHKYVIDNVDSQVDIVTCSDSFVNAKNSTTEQKMKFFDFMRDNLDCINIVNRNLLTLLLKMECGVKQQELNLFVEQYSKYMEYYKNILQKLWWTAKPVYECVLGVYSFFEQYDSTQGAMKPKLLITNELLSITMEPRNVQTIRLYLESSNEKNYVDNVIWYAIVPRIEFYDIKKANIRERFKSGSNEYVYDSNDEHDISRLISMLCEYKIHCFVSANATAQSTFVNFSKQGMELWDGVFDFLDKVGNKEHISTCIPNFTLIPRSFTMIEIGSEVSYNQFRDELEIGNKVRIWFDDLNIEASYVAAGLFAAVQCPNYLKRYYPNNTSMDLPGVAYRMCSDNHEYITTTQMFHEVVKYSQTMTDEILRRSCGIVFAPYKSKICVLTDRTMSYDITNPDTVSIVQTATYIERIIRFRTQDFKENLIKEFFQERPDSLISRWKNIGNTVNNIIKKGEGIKYTINSNTSECNFELQFHEVRKDNTVSINR